MNIEDKSLPYAFDLLLDIKTESELSYALEYLYISDGDFIKLLLLMREHGIEIKKKYIKQLASRKKSLKKEIKIIEELLQDMEVIKE